MKLRLWVLIFTASFAAACGSTVAKSNTDTKTERTFNAPYASVKTAAREALQANGFDLTGEEEGFLTGHRPNQVGLFVGSGGENMGVWLTNVSPSQTKVGVVTKLTAAGVVGQRSWDDDVLKSIDEKLKAGGLSPRQ